MAKTKKKGKEKEEKEQKLPEALETQRRYVICGPDMNYHTNTATAASMYMPLGVFNSWDFKEFADNFEIRINHMDASTMEFDIIGIDPAVANALRRILISEVPTVAIEHVFIINNTSVIQDEVLSHRLGLVPLRIHPDLLEWRAPEDAPNDTNTVVFKLHMAHARDHDKDKKVLSRDLQWLPAGSELPEETGCRFTSNQATRFPAADPPRAVEGDILLARLGRGQEVELEAHCVKGIGREHAKWSPVATAWYRLHPEVVLLQPVEGELAAELVTAVPGLFELEEGGGVQRVRVNDPRQHEDKLEKVRRLGEQDKWREVVQLRKRKDHFIFTIESTGVMQPEELFTKAVEILKQKCTKLAERL